jgi:hypothetical protein
VNQTVTFDLSTNVGEVNFAHFIANLVKQGLTFEAKVEGVTAKVILTGGF